MATTSQFNPRIDSAVDDAPARRPVNLRSVMLGLAGVVFICGITPYNDYALNNTFLVGNFLPIGLLMFFVLFVALINAPLWRWAPGWAFGAGELAVAMGMVLVSCALPSSGLMRYLPGTLVGLPQRAGLDAELRGVLDGLQLPDWVFPQFTEGTWLQRSNDPIVTEYFGRAHASDDSFLSRVRAVPWSAWARPALAWGALLAALFGAILCGSVIVRRQWVENERLPFPLASVYLSLIDPPERGKAFNAMFRARVFWVAFLIPFLIHSLNLLHAYVPDRVPQIPIRYDFGSLMSESPWKYADWGVRTSQIYFVVLGVTFFLQSSVAFSLWAFYLFINIVRMIYGTRGSEFTSGAQAEQQAGAVVVFAAFILWTGRQHWALVLRNMFARVRNDETGDQKYLPYALAGWGFVACGTGMVAWLAAAGASVVGALVIVLMMFLLFLVLARVTAETGLIFVQLRIRLNRPWLYAASELPALLAARTTMRSHFWTNMFNWLFTNDMRESLPVYSTYALKLADEAAYNKPGLNWRRSMPFVGCLVLALAIGGGVAGASTLYVEYNHAVTLDASQSTPISNSGWQAADAVLENTRAFEPPRTGPTETHNRWGHLLFGGAVTALLGVLRLAYVGFPLHPVGFLVANSFGMRNFWLSIFIGWLLSVLIIRFGGADLFRRAKPFFMGLILGECGAAAFWLVANVVLASLGINYINSRLLPG